MKPPEVGTRELEAKKRWVNHDWVKPRQWFVIRNSDGSFLYLVFFFVVFKGCPAGSLMVSWLIIHPDRMRTSRMVVLDLLGEFSSWEDEGRSH